MDDLKMSINQYRDQLSIVNEALSAVSDNDQRESLLALRSELTELIQLTQENLDAVSVNEGASSSTAESKEDGKTNNTDGLDEEYDLFMQEMAKSGAYEPSKTESQISEAEIENGGDSDIEPVHS
ncbi:hypothetical protein evm_004942 [Chilo suppressalis]|nr:hypothetical protein evm_004942 [Chilo suppressalis]